MLRRIRIAIPVSIALLALLAVPALAQEGPQPHTSSKGYSIMSPTGWEVVSGELDQQELEKLPRSIRDHYDPRTTDVMFMDLAGSKDNEFKDNLNTVVLDEPVPISEELIGELKTILTDQYKSLFENFELVSFEQATFGENAAVRIQATYTLLGYNLVLYQALMTGPTKTLVITCTMDQARKDDRIKTCDEAFTSVKFQ